MLGDVVKLSVELPGKRTQNGLVKFSYKTKFGLLTIALHASTNILFMIVKTLTSYGCCFTRLFFSLTVSARLFSWIGDSHIWGLQVLHERQRGHKGRGTMSISLSSHDPTKLNNQCLKCFLILYYMAVSTI